VTRKTENGTAAFDAYFSSYFASRWPALRSALLEPVNHQKWDKKLLQPYYLDSGSIEAALALPLVENGKILDMCAAPGGKSLVIAGAMPDTTELIANEFSRERRKRLFSVLDQYLPEDTRSRVQVTGHDAAKWSRFEQHAYDGILLDVPCSSERHVLSSPVYLADWSPARIRNLAQRQWSLLSGAWLVLKPAGYLVYATCALSSVENDEVVAKLLKKYPDVCICEPVFSSDYISSAEKTSYGWHILPDTAAGSGPLFYTLIRKNQG
jgi:16S rRNA C967 or C1407 C5-methylase (RsmB/RsmF family)